VSDSPLLPALRNDLELLPASPANDGSPRWSVYDPIAHRYTSVGVGGFAALSQWQAGQTIETFVTHLSERGVELDAEEVEAMLQNVFQQGWAIADSEGATQRLIDNARKSEKSLFNRILHGYLFFKVPLIKPDPWLGRLSEFLLFLRSPILLAIIFALGVLGLGGVVTQWSVFLSTFPEFFNWQGIGLYAVALVLLKIAHEFGHAIEAKWKGVRVGTMGVAFLVLFPIMYTEVTDAWRLKNKWDRLAIAMAGLKVELSIAAIALFIWSMATPGQLKTLSFVIATSAVISSLLVNLSPFMRFDGYFALADISGIDNLQGRSFAVARWWLRRFLFGYLDPCPEQRSRGALTAMVLYSYGTWIYRFFLFLGIAILVYSIAFKLLGIVLFLIEIWFFIARPIFAEVRHWWAHRAQTRWTRSGAVSAVFFTLMLLWFAAPVSSTIQATGVLTASKFEEYFVSQSGWVEQAIDTAGAVSPGQVVVKVRSPEQRFNREILVAQRELLESKLRLSVAAGELAEAETLSVRLEGVVLQLNDLGSKDARNTLRSESEGRWIPAEGLQVGRFWPANAPLGQWVEEGGSQLVAYIPLSARDRMDLTSEITFVDDSGRIYTGFDNLSVEQVAPKNLSVPELGSIYGGDLPVRSADQALVFDRDFVRLTATLSLSVQQARIKGRVHLVGRPQTQFSRLVESVAEIASRESGF